LRREGRRKKSTNGKASLSTTAKKKEKKPLDLPIQAAVMAKGEEGGGVRQEEYLLKT